MQKFMLILMFTALTLSSCSLFEPRVPENPTNSGVVWQDPTSPDIVMENMQSALNGGSLLYLDCMADSFVFFADTNDINGYPTYNFNSWGKSDESRTVTALFAVVPKDSTVTSEFLTNTGHPDPAAPADSVTIYREYSITVPQSFHSGTGTPAVGIAELLLVEDSEGFWTITEWHDVRHEGTSWVTWAVAKAYYR
jgi:hypothetical protein